MPPMRREAPRPRASLRSLWVRRVGLVRGSHRDAAAPAARASGRGSPPASRLSFRVVRLLGYAVAVAALALAGCGGEREAKKEAEKSGRGPLTCTGSTTADVVAFPAPVAVSFVKATKTGPTATYDGYSTASLDETFDGFKSAFDKAGYD